MFKKDALDTIVSNLESAEADLVTKTDANTLAQSAATKAQGDLTTAQAANRTAVAALKAWATTIDDDGNDVALPVAATPQPVPDPALTPPVA